MWLTCAVLLFGEKTFHVCPRLWRIEQMPLQFLFVCFYLFVTVCFLTGIVTCLCFFVCVNIDNVRKESTICAEEMEVKNVPMGSALDS